MSKAWLAALCAAGLMAATTAPASAETVKVGVIAPFSGPFARWGEQFQQAIKVYQKQHGESVNGNTIEVVYRDSGGPDPARAKQLAEELILREQRAVPRRLHLHAERAGGGGPGHRSENADDHLQRFDGGEYP